MGVDRTPAATCPRGGVRSSAAAYAMILSEIARCLERAVELPQLRVQLTTSVDDATPILEIERIATQVREIWESRTDHYRTWCVCSRPAA